MKKNLLKIIIIGGIASLLLFVGVKLLLATATSATSPGTMADDSSVGTIAWDNPDNAKASDNIYTTIIRNDDSRLYYDYEIKIIKADGSIGTTNKADTTTRWPTTEAYVSYGSSSDLWGETWTPANINDVDFGVVIRVKGTSLGSVYSHYLKATNFGFSIPTGATINGILVEIEKKENNPVNVSTAFVDHIRITVYYTEVSGATGNMMMMF